MCMLGMTLEQAARSFGWGAMADFARHLPADSATFRAMHPDAYVFASDLKGNAILADLFDAVSAFAHNYAVRNGSKGGRPKPYPRPWNSGGEKRIGSGAIPVSEIEKWYYGGD